MRTLRIATLAIAAVAAFAANAGAAPRLVALVENLKGNAAGIEFMDYLEAGKIIRLGPQDRIVLSYMTSCVRETITGGTITVGTDQSEVQSGKVERTKVQCDTGRAVLSGEQANQVAGRVFRGPTPASVVTPGSDGQPIVYGASPMLQMHAPGILNIERIDQAGERYSVYVGREQLLQGAFYDFAQWRRTLAAGGTYRASVGTQEIVFKVDPTAKPGPIPIVSRLLLFPAPN